MAIIKTEGLTYIYNEKTPQEKAGIQNINLSVENGEFVGIIGHTGSGKSTLIQHFNGLLKPHSGKVYVDGRDIWEDKSKMQDVRFKVGLVFQYPEYQLFEETCYKDIAFGPKNMGLDDNEIDKRVKEACEFVELDKSLLGKSPFEISGGQKRRVAIAGVIAMKPKVLVLDEPTAGLDPKGRESILKQIKTYHREEKNTIMLVSHSMEDVASFATKILVIKDADVFTYDTVENVFAKSKELLEMGLDIPQITKVFLALKERGYDISSNIFTVKQAKQEILSRVKQGDVC